MAEEKEEKEQKTEKSEYKEYVRELSKLSRSEPEDLLLDAIRARLKGEGPALQPGEGDLVDVLILVYKGLRQQKDEKAARRLRKAAADILMEALRAYESAPSGQTAAALEFIDGAGHMVAWFELRLDEGLSADLSDKLLGFLNSRFAKPLENIMDLDGFALEIAVRALDLWLAATPWRNVEDSPEHFRKRLLALHRFDLNRMESSPSIDDTRIRLMLLGFRAVLRFSPFVCGSTAFPETMACLDKLCGHSDKFKKKWYGLAHEIKVLFKRNPEWRDAFVRGAANMEAAHQEFFMRSGRPDITEKTLQYMGLSDEMDGRLSLLVKSDPKEKIKDLIDKRKVVPIEEFRKVSQDRRAG